MEAPRFSGVPELTGQSPAAGAVLRWFSAGADGVKKPYPAPFDHAMYLILNLAVGGSWVGYPDEATDFEHAAFEVDYVRVYQKN